ncbi:5de7a886-8ec8-409d-aa03-8849f14582bd [Sclerotinia trifoliorum]|uniref:5de7a886-8ec8-409d-aa03-8849f14582bd n=1 Tax=Sclerotinia trifoliorum TaxID=28548 RepID=A0A8H2W2P7_9HELO|nr:5de7a886-8ec8-409d-aa03-8849f14582bd [Sclerotinia trifoliorum]
MLFRTIQITLFSTLSLAAPTASNNIFGRGTTAIALINGIAPDAVNSCTAAEFPAECATAAQAAIGISKAVGGAQFHAGEIGAMTAVMAYETASFQYNINHFPGNPGQGTRNMQHPNYNLQYARSIDALKEPLAKITTATTTEGLPNATLNAIMALVTPDEYTWGSAPWYLKTQCDASVRKGLAAGSDDAWTAYLECIGAGDDFPERKVFWDRAKKTLGVGV